MSTIAPVQELEPNPAVTAPEVLAPNPERRSAPSRSYMGRMAFLLLLLMLSLVLTSCEDRPELQDGSYLAVSDIDRGDGWVAWLYVEVDAGSVRSARFDYVHRDDGHIYSETESTINGEAADALFSDYAEAFASNPGPAFDIDRGPSSVSRHIAALAIGIVETSIRGQSEPVLVSAPGDGVAIDAEKTLSFLPVTIPTAE